MSDGPVAVFRSTEEAVYLPLVASMNAAGIRARAMDTAQAGLRWDVQVIAPVEIWVPASDVDAAHLFIAERFAEQPGGAEALGWLPDARHHDRGGFYRWFYIAAGVLLVAAGMVYAFTRSGATPTP